MAKKYVPVFFDWTETTMDLDQTQKGNLIDAIVDYASERRSYDQIIDELSGIERVAFRFMKGQVDRNDEISAARSKAGSSRTEQKQASASKAEETTANDNKVKQTEAKSERSRRQKEKADVAERFVRFWTAYPRKESKPNAQRAWEKINPDEELTQKILAAIEKQKSSEQWQEDGGKYIPHPATWLNNKRWEDEVRATEQVKSSAAGSYHQRDYSSEQQEAMKRFIRMNENG